AQDIQEQKIYVLYGLGGAGKTQIALKFIKESTHFTDRLLIDTSSAETIETGLSNIAIAKQFGSSSQDALTWLGSKHEDWLLFFDNADNPQINLNRFFPKCNHGNIIVTSRNPGLKAYGAYSQVSDMKATDSVALLLKCAGQETSPANKLLAAKIVKASSFELAYLPLAIVQAGAFILASSMLDSYLALYKKHRAQLLSERPAQSYDDYAWTVYTTWQISFDKLSASAVMLLQLCSFIHQEGISEWIFSRASKGLSQQGLHMPLKFLSPFMDPSGEWDPLCFAKLTKELKVYSLIDYNAERKSFSIHPLVHSWSRTTVANQELYCLEMSAILGMAIQRTPQWERRLVSLGLVPHLDSLRLTRSKLAINFQQEYAAIYYHARRYAEAEEFGVAEVERMKKVGGDDHLA
ncbi:P-loop containing nucleoside triphosphate hydrolase protein, partial [Mycena sanguinolenta]